MKNLHREHNHTILFESLEPRLLDAGLQEADLLATYRAPALAVRSARHIFIFLLFSLDKNGILDFTIVRWADWEGVRGIGWRFFPSFSERKPAAEQPCCQGWRGFVA